MSILKSLGPDWFDENDEWHEGASVFSVELTGDKRFIEIVEECDNYFGTTLSKTQFKELLDELTELHNQMIEDTE